MNILVEIDQLWEEVCIVKVIFFLKRNKCQGFQALNPFPEAHSPAKHFESDDCNPGTPDSIRGRGAPGLYRKWSSIPGLGEPLAWWSDHIPVTCESSVVCTDLDIRCSCAVLCGTAGENPSALGGKTRGISEFWNSRILQKTDPWGKLSWLSFPKSR